jgi:NDP-sugar pyrophosphorylase family protein
MTVPVPEAVILAGGLGTRLRPVINDRPKAMASIAGRPFLEWMIEKLARQGVRRALICTGHMGEYIENHFATGHFQGVEIVYSRESSPLGTGGALRLALPKMLGPRFLVLNGDSFCDFKLQMMQEIHLQHGVQATLWLVPVADSGRYGAVAVDSRQKIVDFSEKSSSGGPGLINAGVYLLERTLVENIAEGTVCSLEKDVFPKLIGRGLAGLRGEGPFLDIGTPESYAMAEEFMRREA